MAVIIYGGDRAWRAVAVPVPHTPYTVLSRSITQGLPETSPLSSDAAPIRLGLFLTVGSGRFLVIRHGKRSNEVLKTEMPHGV